MAVIACDACGGKMNDGLAVCPHCGARRALTERPVLSHEEIRALLVTDPVARDAEPARGMLQTMVLPHPATSGGARLAELVLTVLGLPLVVAGGLALGLTRRARLTSASGGELPAALAMTVFGGAGLLGLPPLVVGVSVAAVWLRALIRSRAAGRGSDLHRIEPPPRERPAPPPALAVHAEPAAPAVPAAIEPPAGAAAEPRLLR
jgi:hypothetical protein